MRSNVCKIDSGTKDLKAILKECERVAEYNELTYKQSLHLRLICEEIDGLLPNIIDDFEGELWIECEESECRVNLSIKIPELDIDKKQELIAIAKDKKNSAAVGIIGKIRNSIENFFLDELTMRAFAASSETISMTNGYSDTVSPSYVWTLEEYRDSVKQSENEEDWDELEKSVIASVADNVTVGVKGKQASIVITKKFK